MGGRVALVNNVLDVLPTYMMSVFPMLTNIMDRMEAIRRNFIWQAKIDPNSHKIHLVKWDDIIANEKTGGLGIRNLKLQNANHSLLMKWLWRFASQEQSLWKETIKTRYGMEDFWTSKAALLLMELGSVGPLVISSPNSLATLKSR